MAPHRVLRLRFGTFDLDEANARLTSSERAVPLPPKAFHVLCTLARHRGELVTKDALLDAVWGHRHVSESVLKSTISEVRAALDDDARKPRYIETVSRFGYRFIGDPLDSAVPQTAGVSSVPSDHFVGRVESLQRLRRAWTDAAAGRRKIVWVTGEPGIGKTTLIDHFSASLAPVTFARGQCVGEFGAGEPYLPVLEALGQLSRADPKLAPLMGAVAPTWLLQLPWLTSDTERESLNRTLMGATQDRMVREFGEMLDRYTERQALLLVTEDLHWADHATLRLIDHMARRRVASRLMWVATFRLAEIVAENHPLRLLRHELRLHQLSEEIALEPFSEHEVGQYLSSRLPKVTPERVVRALHARTEGLPLFMATAIEDVRLQEILQTNQDGEGLDLLIARLPIPESVAGVIESQIERLRPDPRSVLEAASVCGVEFRVSVLAALLGRDPTWVRGQCDELTLRQHWLAAPCIEQQLDGSLDARHAFRHALYQRVFYQRQGGLARAELHRRVAQQLERRIQSGAAVMLTELASHYERGQDFQSALRQYALAATGALNQLAPTETLHLTRHALDLLPQCRPGTERDQLELALLRPRVIALQQLMGVATPEAAIVYERVLALADLLPEKTAHGLELGLGWVYFVRGEYDKARALVTRIEAAALGQGDGARHVAACNVLGATLLFQGELFRAKQCLEEGLVAFAELTGRFEQAPLVVDLDTAMRARLCQALAHLGLMDQARRQVEVALARSASLNRPVTYGVALTFAALLQLRFDHPDRVLELADPLLKLVSEHSLAELLGPALCLKGWALGRRGQCDAGHALIRQGVEHYLARGNLGSGCPALIGFGAEALLWDERWSDAQAEVGEALALATRTGERLFVPDLLLIQGRIALGRGEPQDARASLQAALQSARAQQALWLELTSLVALCELEHPERADWEALNDVCGRLQEGRDVALVGKALELLRTQRLATH